MSKIYNDYSRWDTWTHKQAEWDLILSSVKSAINIKINPHFHSMQNVSFYFYIYFSIKYTRMHWEYRLNEIQLDFPTNPPFIERFS